MAHRRSMRLGSKATPKKHDLSPDATLTPVPGSGRSRSRPRKAELTRSSPPALEEFDDPQGGHQDYFDEDYGDFDINSEFNEPEVTEEDYAGDEVGEGDDEEFIVEKILDHVIEDNELRFKVKWDGYDDPSDLTWEPEDNLAEAQEVLQEYYEKVGGREALFNKPKNKKRKRGRRSTNSVLGGRKERVPKKSRHSHPADSTPPRDEYSGLGKFQPPSGSWEDHIENIDAIQGDDGKLWIYLTWKTGEKTRHDTKTIYKRCPQQVRLTTSYQSLSIWLHAH